MELPRAFAAGGPSGAERPIDLVCLGRVAVDLYCEQIGSALADAQSFRIYLGGCAGNVAVGAARLGLRVEMFSRVGADELGRFLRAALEREGVGTAMLVDDPEHLSGLVVLGVAPPDRFPLLFYRERCADMETRLADVEAAAFDAARALFVTGTGLSRPETAAATLEIVREARRRGAAVVFDLDYRPVLWGLVAKGDGESRYVAAPQVTAALAEAVALADLVVGTEEELAIAGGDEDVERAVARLRQRSPAIVVRKRGAAGCRLYAGEAEIDVPALAVEVLNVLGAGDAFVAGFLRGWLRGEALATCGWWANVNGGLVVTRHACAPAMASFEELQAVAAAEDPRAASRAPELARLHRRAGGRRGGELLVLAGDHRTQLEEDCRRAGASRERIAEFKLLIWRAFEAAGPGEAGAQRALLMDPLYGAAALAAASARGHRVGAPIEASGVAPLDWIGEGSLYAQILARPRRWFVKALVHLHPELDEGTQAVELRRIRELQQVCDELERELMLEVVAPAGLEFGAGELPRAVEAACAAGADPCWWKVPPQSAADWRRLDDALAARGSDAGLIVLGGALAVETLREAFAALRRTRRASGFAVGRTVFREAWRGFLAGELAADAAVAAMAERYLELLDAWRRAAPSAVEVA